MISYKNLSVLSVTLASSAVIFNRKGRREDAMTAKAFATTMSSCITVVRICTMRSEISVGR